MDKGHEFIIVQDIMRENEIGELELVREDAPFKWYCADVSLITDIDQVYDRYGKIKTKYCRVYHTMLGDRVVRAPYTEVKNIVKNSTTHFFKGN